MLIHIVMFLIHFCLFYIIYLIISHPCNDIERAIFLHLVVLNKRVEFTLMKFWFIFVRICDCLFLHFWIYSFQKDRRKIEINHTQLKVKSTKKNVLTFCKFIFTGVIGSQQKWIGVVRDLSSLRHFIRPRYRCVYTCVSTLPICPL